MIKKKRLVEEFPTLELYFHDMIQEALRHQKIQADEHVSFYLVNLLANFTKTETVFCGEEGQETPLAVLFCRAQTESLETRGKLLKFLGDFSLFISGFFQDSLNRKLVDLDYYVSMGGGAYHQLSSLSVFRKQQMLFSQIFSELACRFVQWVDVISEVSENCQINSYSDLLRMYEKFLRTGSQRMRDLLMGQGIIADESLPTRFTH